MFDSMLLDRLGGVEYSLTSQAQFYFDAVWAAGLTLNATAGKSHNWMKH